MDLYAPLVTKFMEDQEAKIFNLVSQMVVTEKWIPVDSSLKCSSSVVDMFSLFIGNENVPSKNIQLKFLTETSPFSFSLTLSPLMEFFIGTTTGLINRCIKSYVATIVEHYNIRVLLFIFL